MQQKHTTPSVASSPEADASDVLLLVEDEPSNLKVLYETLNGRGYRLLTAKSGEQALAIALKAHPVLVLLDIMMPGIDGFETCQRLKANPETRDAAVIFLSALEEAKDKVRGFALGAVDFISKPFDAEEVIARVETHLTIRRLERTLLRTNRELAAAAQRMKLELEAAARVQQSFLPEAAPDVEGARFAWAYRPCQDLGGDYFNVFAFDRRHVGVLIVDVCGHGVASSLLTVSVARTLSALRGNRSLVMEASATEADAYRISAPSDVLRRLNTLYPMDMRARLYFTCLYGVLDLEKPCLRFASAGNPGPIVVHSDGSTERHDRPGIPIGLLADADYEDYTLALQPGDRLYFYSDGLSEERNPDGRLFGAERMRSVIADTVKLGLDESIAKLIGAVVAWRGSESLHDDIAIVATQLSGA